MVGSRTGVTGAKRSESVLVGALVAHFFLIAASRMLVFSPSFGLFLDVYDSTLLPWLYVAVAVLAVGGSALYLRASSFTPRGKLFASILLLVVIVTVLMRFGLTTSLRDRIIFALPIWYDALWVVTNLEMWALAGVALDVQQAKRVFPLLVVGKSVGELASGLVTAPLITWIGTENLMLLGAGGFCMALAVIPIVRTHRPDVMGKVDTPSQRARADELRNNSYLRILWVHVGLGWCAYFVADVVFYRYLEIRFAQGEDELTSFIAMFFGVLAGAAIVGSLLTPWVLRRVGVRGSILILPTMLLFTYTALGFVSPSLGWGVEVVLVLVIVGKAADVLLVNIIDVPAINILYQPLGLKLLARVQGIADGVIYPVAAGMVGLVLLLVGRFFAVDAIDLSRVLAVLAVVWVMTALWVGHAYPQVVQRAIGSRFLDDRDIEKLDAAARVVLERAATQGSAPVVRYVLDLFGRLEVSRLGHLISRLLEREDAEVRRLALVAASQHPQLGLGANIEAALDDPEPEVRGAALAALCAVRGDEVTTRLLRILDDSGLEPEIRRGALLGLLRHGGEHAAKQAEARVLALAAAPDPATRVLAAEVMAGSADERFVEAVSKALDDPDLEVRRAALEAAGALAHPRLLEPLRVALSVPRLRAHAFEALEAYGDGLAAPLAADLARADADRSRIVDLLLASRQAIGDSIDTVLIAALGHADPEVERELLSTLLSRRYKQTPSATLDAAWERAWARIARIEITRQRLEVLDWAVHLERALQDERRLLRSSLLDILALRHGIERVQAARFSLRWGDDRARAVGLVELELLLPSALYERAVPILDDKWDPNRVIPVLNESEPTIVAAIMRSTPQSLVSAIIEDPVAWPVDWTRLAARHALLSKNAGELAPELRDDPTMLLVEKVALLRSIREFAETPDAVLASLARVAVERSCQIGEVFIEQGKWEDAMFVVVAGEVDIVINGKYVSTIGRGELLGELQVIEPGPRAATARCRTEVHLLQIAQADFDELVTVRPEIARAIARLLVRRLRKLSTLRVGASDPTR